MHKVLCRGFLLQDVDISRREEHHFYQKRLKRVGKAISEPPVSDVLSAVHAFFTA